MNQLLIIDPSHPDIVLVDEDKWPEELAIPANCQPYKDHCTRIKSECDCWADLQEYSRQKSEALKQGAVVDRLPDELTLSLPCENYEVKAGVYELDPAKWKVEIRWQYRFITVKESDWEHCEESKLKDYQLPLAQTRQIALISPAETPKEKHWRQKCNEAQQCHCTDMCMFYLADKQNRSVEQEGKKVDAIYTLDELLDRMTAFNISTDTKFSIEETKSEFPRLFESKRKSALDWLVDIDKTKF